MGFWGFWGFWIAALGMAAAAAGLLVLAVLRRRDAMAAAASDLAVYRDQLREVDRDLARGLLAPEDAERARAEIGRRVIEADRALSREAAAAARGQDAPRIATLAMTGAAALAVVAGSAWLYLRIGAPGYPDLPLQARIALAEQARSARPSQAEAVAQVPPAPRGAAPAPDYLALIERLRSVVAERPNDPEGLALLARHEAALGNLPAAEAAQLRLIAVKGDAATGQDLADLADLRIMAAGGYVSPEAEEALARALALDPGQPVARYYKGLLHAQTGRPDLAFRFWSALLAEGPPGAPWIAPIRAQIEDIAWRAGQHNFSLPPETGPETAPGAAPESAPGAPAPRGPTAAQVEAAEGLTPEQRQDMIRGMVGALAERLAAEGGPAEDWAQLIRAYAVLGEAEKAAPVLAEARTRFAGDDGALSAIEAAARDAGLSE